MRTRATDARAPSRSVQEAYMKIAELLKLYRYNHYSNPDKLTYKDNETSDPLMAIKVD